MQAEELVEGRIYCLKSGDLVRCCGTGSTGLAIFYPACKSTPQFCFTTEPENVERELSLAEIIECERAACEQAIRDSGIKRRGDKADAFATIEAAIEAIKRRRR